MTHAQTAIQALRAAGLDASGSGREVAGRLVVQNSGRRHCSVSTDTTAGRDRCAAVLTSSAGFKAACDPYERGGRFLLLMEAPQ